MYEGGPENSRNSNVACVLDVDVDDVVLGFAARWYIPWYCLVTCGGVFSKEVHIFSDFCSSIIMAAFQDQAMKHASLGVVQPF